MSAMKKAVIVGGGLVGYLSACYLARDGFTVEVYEKYPDPRQRKPECFRSINLTLSQRGEGPLREIGLLDAVLAESIPAYGRVAWDKNGEVLGKVNYGEKGESIQSVSRFGMNLTLLRAADCLEEVQIYFGHELILCDFDKGTATFAFTTEDGERKEKTVSADLFIGADGAHSAMRAEMSKQRKLDYIDFQYHEHYYLEMLIPPKNNDYQMEKNRLHVWPKDSYVLICLPNPDKSFSGTLVMPKHKFNQMLESEESLVKFWREELNAVYNLVGEENLIDQFRPGRPNVRSPCRLVSLKCEPYHAPSTSGIKFVLLGDAAHAMVPFYGQGMNTGFEDVQIFNQIRKKHGNTEKGIGDTIEEFSLIRCKDGHAMSDFSYDHYEKLRSKVKKQDYNLRRHIDSTLHRVFPEWWIPEYTLVAFSHKPQSQCRQICKNQDQIMRFLFYGLMVVMVVPLLLTTVMLV